jgi:hypothetical protein
LELLERLLVLLELLQVSLLQLLQTALLELLLEPLLELVDPLLVKPP